MSMGPQQCRYGSGCGVEGNGFPLESPILRTGALPQKGSGRIFRAGTGALGEGSAASGGFRGVFLEMAFFCN